jgi:hypothetical protein
MVPVFPEPDVAALRDFDAEVTEAVAALQQAVSSRVPRRG